MKRAITSIVAAGIALGTMAPAAFAASTSVSVVGKGNIDINGTAVYTGVSRVVAKDAGNSTSYFPVWYLEQALTKAGYTNNIDTNNHNWDITLPGVDASKIAVDGGQGSGNASISINGTVVKYFNYVAAKDPAGGSQDTTFFPVYYLENVLKALGWTSAWDGTNFNFAQAQAAIASSAAVGAKKLSVTFTQPVDTSKAAFTVTKSGIAVNVSDVSWNSSKTVATLDLANFLTAGDYTIKVGGLGLAAGSDTATVTAQDQKVTAIKFLSNNAVESTDASGDNLLTVGYQLLNQYGEDVTASTSGVSASLVATSSYGTTATSASNGTFTINLGTAAFPTLGSTVPVSLLDSTSASFASANLTVSGAAHVASIQIGQLIDTTGKGRTQVTAGDAGSDYEFVVTAKDQYGNTITDPKQLTSDLVVTPSGNGGLTAGSFSTDTVNGSTVTVYKLAGTAAAGTETYSFISTTTGQYASAAVQVKAAAAVDTVSMSAPSLAVAGETTNIPFTAVDQFGNAATNSELLAINPKSVTTSDPNVTASFKEDYVTGKVNLVLDASYYQGKNALTTAENIYVNVITPSGKLAQVSFQLQPTAVPTVITGTTKLDTAYATGAQEKLTAANIVVDDQYGRAVTSLPSGYDISISSSNPAAVSVTSDTAGKTAATAVGTAAYVNGVAAGSSTITVGLTNGGKAVSGSQYTFNLQDVDKSSIASYSLGTVPTLWYNDGTVSGNYSQPLSVTGKLADGSTVAVPSSYFTVTINDSDVTYNASTGTISANKPTTPKTTFDSNGNATVPVVVTVNGANGAQVLTENVTVSNVAPAPATISLDSTNAAYVSDKVVAEATATAATNPLAIAKSVVLVTDQYGVSNTYNFTGVGTDVIVTGLPTGATLSSGTISGLTSGETYNITVITANGHYFTFQVVAN